MDWQTMLLNVSKMKTSNIILWVAIIGAALTFGLLLHAQQPLERVGDPPLHYKPGQQRPKPKFEVLDSWKVEYEMIHYANIFHLQITGHEYLLATSSAGQSLHHSEGCSNPRCQSK